MGRRESADRGTTVKSPPETSPEGSGGGCGRRGTLLRCSLLVVGVLAIAVFGAPAWWVWNPRTDDVTSADAIVVLAYGEGRLEAGRRLAAEGVSDQLVISQSRRMLARIEDGSLVVVSPEGLAEGGAPEGSWVEECEAQYEHYVTHCLQPDPNTTVGEALAVSAMARDEGWGSIVVVTERSHVARADRIFDACTRLDVEAVSAGNPGTFPRYVYRTVYEISALVKDWATNPC